MGGAREGGRKARRKEETLMGKHGVGCLDTQKMDICLQLENV